MSRRINWAKDGDKRRMRERGTEAYDGELDTRTQALLRPPPVIRKSKAEMRAELNAAMLRSAVTPAREAPVKATGSNKLVDIEAEIRHESPKAFLLFDGKREGWVPKSKTEDNRDGSFTMPEWLAAERGFI